ncbi:MAG: hypothetical protein IKR78_02935 [Dehalococcoidales bacterium]|nr:hypothetical protein [Dehalococcoidales bacterium]
MERQTISIDKLKTLLHKPLEPFTYTLSRELVSDYIGTVKNSPDYYYSGLIVPCFILPTLGCEQMISKMLEMKGIVLQGGSTLSVYEQIPVGCTVSINAVISNIKESKLDGYMCIITIDKDYYVNDGLVAHCRQLSVVKGAPTS